MSSTAAQCYEENIFTASLPWKPLEGHHAVRLVAVVELLVMSHDLHHHQDNIKGPKTSIDTDDQGLKVVLEACSSSQTKVLYPL